VQVNGKEGGVVRHQFVVEGHLLVGQQHPHLYLRVKLRMCVWRPEGVEEGGGGGWHKSLQAFVQGEKSVSPPGPMQGPLNRSERRPKMQGTRSDTF